MPHVRCNACGVVSWSSARADGAPCPECGVPAPRQPTPESEDPARRLTKLVSMTRELLDVDVALLTEIDDGSERACVVAGEFPGLALTPGASMPLSDTYCRLMLEGRIANVVGDTRAEESMCDLPLTKLYSVAAYMGVPIAISDAELYVLCCLAREARPSFGTREVRLLSGLAESVSAELQATRSPASAL